MLESQLTNALENMRMDMGASLSDLEKFGSLKTTLLSLVETGSLDIHVLNTLLDGFPKKELINSNQIQVVRDVLTGGN